MSEYVTGSPLNLGLTQSQSLRLPYDRTPQIDSSVQWVSVRDFGAIPDGPSDGSKTFRGGDGADGDYGLFGDARVEAQNGTVRYLGAPSGDFRFAGGPIYQLRSDELPWASDSSYSWLFPSILQPSGPSQTMKSMVYSRGVGIAWGDIKYDLGGAYSRLKAVVGMPDGSIRGSVAIKVIADGVVLYDSICSYRTDPTVTLDLDVTGVQRLRIVVEDGRLSNSKHLLWLFH